MPTILLIVLLIIVLGGGGLGWQAGNPAFAYGGGLLGVVLIIVLVLAVLGRV